MKFKATLAALPLLLFLVAAGMPTAAAQSAAVQLGNYDKTLYSGYLEARASLYAPPDAKGRYAPPAVYPVQVLFERPDRFRFVVRPGAKDEYRAVAEGGMVQWLDLATGLSDKHDVREVVEPLALALLGSAGELARFGATKDVPLAKQAGVVAARMQVRSWGSHVDSALAFFRADGQPSGFEFTLRDGARLFLAVDRFEPNVQTSSTDFRL
jgi:hypothetical protein